MAKDILSAEKTDPEWENLRTKLELSDRKNISEDITLEEGLVCFKKRVWVPEDNGLKLTIAKWYHNSRVAGHFSRDKTLELIKCNYYWPNMEEWICNYVKTCDTYQWIKTECYSKYRKLKPLEISYGS